MLFPDLVGEDDRCDAVSHNQDEHGDALQNRAGNQQTGDDNQDSGQGKTGASCPLTEVPAGVVCHAPLGAKSEYPVSLNLWQDVPNRDERQPQHNAEDFGDGLSRFGSHFKLGTGGEEHRHKKPEKGCLDAASANQHRLVVARVRGDELVQGALPQESGNQTEYRQDENFQTASPTVDFSGKVVVGRDALGQQRQNHRTNENGQNGQKPQQTMQSLHCSPPFGMETVPARAEAPRTGRCSARSR